jgi:hypothetical protein
VGWRGHLPRQKDIVGKNLEGALQGVFRKSKYFHLPGMHGVRLWREIQMTESCLEGATITRSKYHHRKIHLAV